MENEIYSKTAESISYKKILTQPFLLFAFEDSKEAFAKVSLVECGAKPCKNKPNPI